MLVELEREGSAFPRLLVSSENGVEFGGGVEKGFGKVFDLSRAVGIAKPMSDGSLVCERIEGNLEFEDGAPPTARNA